jgi:hypothetical protein
MHCHRNSKIVRIETLDDDGATLSRATGFIVSENNANYLYTCWHVVTGINFLTLDVKHPPKATRLKVHYQQVAARAPGVTAIGGLSTLTLALYENKQGGEPKLPCWEQEKGERPQPDLNAIGIKVPKFADVVRLSVELNADERKVICIPSASRYSNIAVVPQRVIIAGYPYGYSTFGPEFPKPIFLTRHIAAAPLFDSVGLALVDAAASPGMSGAPVFVENQGNWQIAGIYTGLIYPDYAMLANQQLPGAGKNDRHAALGMFYQLSVLSALANM